MKTFLFLCLLPLALLAMTNEEVARRSDAAVSGFGSSVARVRMTLRNAEGGESIREFEMRTLDKEDGDRSLIRFLLPSDIKETRLLTHEVIGGDDRQWIYLPALKRIKRISGSNKSGAFVGSEFSYEDLASFDYRKYRYGGNAEEVDEEGLPCYLGERVPTDAGSAYTKQVIWVDRASFLVRRVDYYDRQNTLAKTARFGGYRKIDGLWRVGTIEMQNHHNRKTTLLEWKEDRVRAGLTEGAFEKRTLKE